MLSLEFEKAIRRHCESKEYVPEEYWQSELTRICEFFLKKEIEAQDYEIAKKYYKKLGICL